VPGGVELIDAGRRVRGAERRADRQAGGLADLRDSQGHDERREQRLREGTGSAQATHASGAMHQVERAPTACMCNGSAAIAPRIRSVTRIQRMFTAGGIYACGRARWDAAAASSVRFFMPSFA
jgi:hypothetical protein